MMSTDRFAECLDSREEPAVQAVWQRAVRRLGSRSGHRLSPTQKFRGSAELVERSGVLDRDWYLKNHPDVAAAGADPVVHFLSHGAAEGRDPNPLFDTRWYLRA